MRKLSLIIIIIQIILILFAIRAEYCVQKASSNSSIFWGERIMKYQAIPIIFFAASFFIAIFIKAKLWEKITIIVLAMIGEVIFNKLWLYPW